MSKNRQRVESAFSAGREFYLYCKKRAKKMYPENQYDFVQSLKKAEYKTLNPKFRSIWHAGWNAARVGIKSNKAKKRELKRRTAPA